jgi:muramidase (phage lysozyme)
MAQGHFNPDINPRLLKLIENMNYDKYKVTPTSGYRPGDPRQHGRGQAIDIQLSDPKTGAALANYQDPSTFGAYQEYANAIYNQALQTDTDLAAQLRWGGYFGGPKGKYGAMDLMHFDTAGQQIPMAGGSWKEGLSPDQAKTWGLQPGGGLGAQAQAMKQAGYSPEQIRTAFLSTVASGESPGYDVMYGGGKFTDMSKHPHQAQTAGGVTSDVAGRYQFKGSTWDEQAAKYGYKDFSPQTQDTAAWNYANDIFKTKTGGSLEEALASGDAGRINAAAQVLNHTWSSLPGGAEQSKGYGNQTFADIYNKNLGGNAAGGTSVHPPNPTVGTGDTPATKKQDPSRMSQFAQKMAENFGDMSGMGSMSSPANTVGELPKAALAAAEPTTYPDASGQDAATKRYNLAMMMQKLNSQKLW